VVLRFLVILRHVVPLALSFLRDHRRYLVGGGPLERNEAFHAARAERLLRSITRLGPGFVKLGQAFAGRSDLLPEPYARTLKALTDRVPPVPLRQVQATIEEGIGRPPEQVFEVFNPEPIAAGSLGQVYWARYEGREVAVKVLRPGVRGILARDVAIAARIARWLATRFPNVHTRSTQTLVEEFSRRVVEEMDFRREAENLLAVKRNFAGNRRIRIPEVVTKISSEKVLVLEFMHGHRVDELEPGRAYGALRAENVVELLIELYLQMMLIDGLYHADPHPGNLLVADDGTLILLDFGLVIQVGRERRGQLLETVIASARSDRRGTVDGLYAMGVVEPGADRAQIEQLVDILLDLADRQTTSRERVEFLTAEIMGELYEWPVRLPGDLVYFARSAGLVEGIGMQYDPYFNPVSSSRPVLYRMRSQLLAALSEGPLPQRFDLPTVLGYLAGRAATVLFETFDRVTRWFNGGIVPPRPEPRQLPASTGARDGNGAGVRS
jgi:predicted unusual protein kinase regulating ubiquinone biosynthesis (AarF/ABC1/UbiB family)